MAYQSLLEIGLAPKLRDISGRKKTRADRRGSGIVLCGDCDPRGFIRVEYESDKLVDEGFPARCGL